MFYNNIESILTGVQIEPKPAPKPKTKPKQQTVQSQPNSRKKFLTIRLHVYRHSSFIIMSRTIHIESRMRRRQTKRRTPQKTRMEQTIRHRRTKTNRSRRALSRTGIRGPPRTRNIRRTQPTLQKLPRRRLHQIQNNLHKKGSSLKPTKPN